MSSVAPPGARPTIPPDTLPVRGAEWLLAELAATHDEAARAELHFALGLAAEAEADDATAARELLLASTAAPSQRAPLERLANLLERRGSLKNLGKVLERLTAASGSDALLAEAHRRLAAHLRDHARQDDAALEQLERAVALQEHEPLLELERELIARALGRADVAGTALKARGAGERASEWSGWLGLLLAQSLEDVDARREVLARLTEREDAVAFTALRELEALAVGEGDWSKVAAHRARAVEWLEQLAARPERGQALGLGRWQTSSAALLEGRIAAATAAACSDDTETARLFLDAAEAAGERWVPTLVRLALAEQDGDVAAAADAAADLLEGGVDGSVGAALWLVQARAALTAEDRAAARTFVERALAADDASVAAWALRLKLASGPELAELVAEAASHVTSPSARVRLLALAATLAIHSGQRERSAAHAEAARRSGLDDTAAAHLELELARASGDDRWLVEALGAAGVGATTSRRLERLLGSARLGDRNGALAAARELTEVPWAGRVLNALRGASPEAERALAELAADGEAAWALLAAKRALLQRQSLPAAAWLERLFADGRGSHRAAAITYAVLMRQMAQPERAAGALLAAADGAADLAVGESLRLEAALTLASGGKREAALPLLEQADAPAAQRLAELVRHGAQATGPFAVEHDGALRALAELASALDAAPVGEQQRRAATSLEGSTGVVASLVFDELEEAAERATDAQLEALGAQLSYAAKLADRGAHPAELLDSAARQAELVAAPHAALALLVAARAAGDRERERAAGELLGARLPELQGSLAARSAILELLDGVGSVPAAPSGEDVSSTLVRLELAGPGADPRRRLDALGSEDNTDPLVLVAAGWNLLAVGRMREAEERFRALVEAHPTELGAWEGLRLMATLQGDRAKLAEACAALGDIVSDDATGAALWEQAGTLLTDELADPERGELAFRRAVDRDVRRPLAFDRCFRAVRARGDSRSLLELIAARLEVAEDPEELAKLFWERARAFRNLDRRDDALEALENVTLLEPDHVGALALTGEIYITLGRHAEAAEQLARLAASTEAPAKQRLMSGVAAVDLFEKKLERPDAALAVLQTLQSAGLATAPVRERLARATLRAERWEEACAVLEQLMEERATSDGRADAARLALTVHRDRRGRAHDAAAAVRRLLGELPTDGEAIDFLLAGGLPEPAVTELLARAKRALLAELEPQPENPEQLELLARVAARERDPLLRQATLGALVALGHGSEPIDAELAGLEERLNRVPQVAIDPQALPDLCDPNDAGAIPELLTLLGPHIARAVGPSLATFGVGKKQKVDPRSGSNVRNEVAAWAGALGLGDFDLYIGGTEPLGVLGAHGERPSLVLGPGVRTPFGPRERQLVARELFALRRGTTVTRHRAPTDVAALIVAAFELVDVRVEAPPYALVGELKRLLHAELPRALRKRIADLGAAFAAERRAPLEAVLAASATLDRLGALAAGDVSHVLANSPMERGVVPSSVEGKVRLERVLRFVVSPTFVQLRQQLGLGLK